MRRRCELMQLEIGMSTRRYLPARGTAGFERSRVSGNTRVPCPPPIMTERTLLVLVYMRMPLAIVKSILAGRCVSFIPSPGREAQAATRAEERGARKSNNRALLSPGAPASRRRDAGAPGERKTLVARLTSSLSRRFISDVILGLCAAS